MNFPCRSISKLKDNILLTPEITAAITDRRKRTRFQMDAELRYQATGRPLGDSVRGTGTLENISSKALAFRTDAPLERGTRLSVSLAWPAKLDDCMLRLAFEGVVLRGRGNLIVMSIERPEFRTAGRMPPPAREETPTSAGTAG